MCAFAAQLAGGGSLRPHRSVAARTPAVVSDQPMFRRTFRDGQGIRFFKGGDSQSLAEVVAQTVADPRAYAGLSEGTLAAFEVRSAPRLSANC